MSKSKDPWQELIEAQIGDFTQRMKVDPDLLNAFIDEYGTPVTNPMADTSYVDYIAEQINEAKRLSDTTRKELDAYIEQKGELGKNETLVAFLQRIAYAVENIYDPIYFPDLQQYRAAIRKSFTLSAFADTWVNPKAPVPLAFSTPALPLGGERQLADKTSRVVLSLNAATVMDTVNGRHVHVSLLSTQSVQVAACDLFRRKMNLRPHQLIEFIGVSYGNTLAVFRVGEVYYESDALHIVRPVEHIVALSQRDAARVVYRECQLLVERKPLCTDADVLGFIEQVFSVYQDYGTFEADEELRLAMKNSPLLAARRLKGLADAETQRDEATFTNPLKIRYHWYYDAEFRMLVCMAMMDKDKRGILNNQLPRYEQHMSGKFGSDLTYIGNAYYPRVEGFVPVFRLSRNAQRAVAYNFYTQQFVEVGVDPKDPSEVLTKPEQEQMLKAMSSITASLSQTVKLTKKKLDIPLEIIGDDPALRPSVRVGLRTYNGGGNMLLLFFNQFKGTDFTDYHGNTSTGQFIFKKADNGFYVLDDTDTTTRVNFIDERPGYGI